MNSKYIFYIYAPAYRSNSAGIKVLHLLANEINKTNFSAFLVIHNPSAIVSVHNFSTPILTNKLAAVHRSEGRIPIVIYSETIVGNPLRAKNVIRYFLNYPGVLGGTTKVNNSELNIAYSMKIGEKVGINCPVLFIPIVDLTELPQNIAKIEGLNLVYAGKYRAFVGTPAFDYGVDVVEIFRAGKLRQERVTVLGLLAAADRLYLWENSTIATEAILLNTPVVFMPSPFLGRIIAEAELGEAGYTLSPAEKDIELARLSLPKAQSQYRAAQAQFSRQLLEMLNFVTQFKGFVPQDKLMKVPTGSSFINMHRIRMFFAIVRHIGWRAAFRVVWEFGYFRINRKNLSP